MRELSVSLKDRLRRIDYVVFFSVLGMTSLSILTLAGAANASANGPRRVSIQIAASLVGLVMAYIISLFDYDELPNVYEPHLADWVKNCLREQEGSATNPTGSHVAALKKDYLKIQCQYLKSFQKEFNNNYS